MVLAAIGNSKWVQSPIYYPLTEAGYRNTVQHWCLANKPTVVLSRLGFFFVNSETLEVQIWRKKRVNYGKIKIETAQHK